MDSVNSTEATMSMNVLVIEKDPEMQSLYNHFFRILLSHVSFTIIDGINKIDLCMDNYDIKDDNHRSNNNTDDKTSHRLNLVYPSTFDVIIIDVNIESIGGIEIAKKILKNNPRQKMILTTTYNLDTIKNKMENGEILSSTTILQKPFRFSDLLSVISPTKGKFDKLKLTDHVIASYSSIQEELTNIVAFIKKGIELDELNLLLIRKDMDIQNFVPSLKLKGLFNIDTLLDDKSLVILKNEDWYIPDGKVNKYRIINQWNDLVKESIKKGKKGLRAFCMMDCFFENGFSTDLMDYECTLPSQFQIPFVPICAYRQRDLDSLPKQERKKLVQCHTSMIICK